MEKWEEDLLVPVVNRDDLISYIWDEYKSVYGVRPRHLNFKAMTDQELIDMADRIEMMLIEEMGVEI